MTVSIMIAGALFRAPVQKIAKSGKPYVTATIKASVRNESEYWTALAFGEAAVAARLAATFERIAYEIEADGAAPAGRASP